MVKRIQRSRERGSRQPVNTKYCGRPTEWGNPFPIGEEYTRAQALEAFREAFWARELPVTPAKVRTELAAYDYLSCWCRLEQPCHVDEYIPWQSPVSTGSVTHPGAIAWYAEHVYTGTSPSRAHGLPARTVARRSSAGERRERILAQSVNAQDRDADTVVHSTIHISEPLKGLKRLLAPGVPRRHLWRLPAPVRLQRSSPSSHPDSQAHTPRVARKSVPKTGRFRHAVNTTTYLRHRQPEHRRVGVRHHAGVMPKPLQGLKRLGRDRHAARRFCVDAFCRSRAVSANFASSGKNLYAFSPVAVEGVQQALRSFKAIYGVVP